jgi:hypothetical protein
VGYTEGMIESHLKDLLATLIDGTIETLDGPIRDAALRLSQAAAIGRADLARECSLQLEVLVRMKRMKIKAQAAGSFSFLLQTGVQMLLNGLIARLAQAKLQ